MNQAFENYVKNYDMNDPDIHYKYYHCYRVMEKSKMLAKNMSKENQQLAEIIGLYHDIGRFEQDKLYNSYKDTKKFNHAEYATKILFDDNLIKEIPIEEKYYHIIEKAIRNHNKYEIEKDLTEKELLHAKLIRDADKLDILYAASAGLIVPKELDLKTKDVKIDKQVKGMFYSNEQINYSILNEPLDISEKLIAFLSLIFDLNFKESFNYLQENKILETIYKSLEAKEKYKEYFDYINNYIKEKIKC